MASITLRHFWALLGMPKTPTERARNWCFTLNNYTDEDKEKIAHPWEWLKYVAYSHEVGEQEGTPHLQGFICCWEKCSLVKVKRMVPRAHLEPMAGSLLHNDSYCSKQDKLIEIGERPMQGRRSDIIGFKRKIDAGETPVQIAEEEPHFGAYVKYHAGLEKYAHHVQGKRIKSDRTMPKVYIRYGESGTGKTKWLDDTFGTTGWARMPNPTGNWWITPTVSSADTVLIDDVGPSKIPKVEEFLEWTDRYPLEFNAKGGFLWWKPKNIVFTSNYSYKQWWPKISDEHLAAVERRLFRVEIVYKDRTEVEFARENGSI